MRAWATILFVATALCVTGSAIAAPPWAALFPFQRVEADPKKEYKLEAKHGPWLVYCAAFVGETAERDARKLCLELRRDFQMEAFIHRQHYDFSQTEKGLGVSRYSTADNIMPRKMRHLQNQQYDELAVMVGSFAGLEDGSLQQALQTIKYARPKALELPKDGTTNHSLRFGGLRDLHQRMLTMAAEATGQKQAAKGPMGMAFATLNPLMPKEEQANPALDRMVLDMNQHVEFSLLKCPGKYTVRVGTFRGRTTIDQREIARIEDGGNMESNLEQAADKANKLTMALRRHGVEAYEFHDRNESLVCIGSFETIGTPGFDGKVELDPGVIAIMNKYGAKQFAVTDRTARPAAGLTPKSLDGITFDVQPWPVQVPRTSIGADYATSNTGFFR